MDSILAGKSLGVIGYGNFGKLLVKIFSAYFRQIKVFSNNLKEETFKKNSKLSAVSLEEVAACDVVIPSVPISCFEAVIKQIAPHLKAGSLLIDVCSVKVLPAKAMLKFAPQNVQLLATHPMWGPESYLANGNSLKDLKIVLCPLRIEKKLFAQIKNGLENLGFKIFIQTPKKHDRQSADSQAIAQFVGKVLEKMPLKDVEISTLGCERLKSLLPFVVKNTEELFFNLQNFNAYSQRVREKFIQTAIEVEGKIRAARADKNEPLLKLRNQIDFIDGLILHLLEERFAIVREVGKFKKQKNLPIVDKNREEELIEKRLKETKLKDDFLIKFYRLIFEAAYSEQL